jgi:phosphoribosyl-ATP pyrophosphohydrolase
VSSLGHGSVGSILHELCSVIRERRRNFREESYTCLLFQRGRKYIEEKLEEELGELMKARGRRAVIEEAADLVYHLLVYLEARGAKWEEVEEELVRRRK